MPPSLTTYSESAETTLEHLYFRQLAQKIIIWGKELGLKTAIIDAQDAEQKLQRQAKYFQQWLDHNHHGTMHFMQKHSMLRLNPTVLMPQVASIICCRLDWKPQQLAHLDLASTTLTNHIVAYAQHRDYHKVMRQRLKLLALQIKQYLISIPPPQNTIENHDKKEFAYRFFCDSAPILEKALAAQAGLGWIGKNTLLLNEDSGSNFFLGEIYTNLPLSDKANSNKQNTNNTEHENPPNFKVKPTLEPSSQSSTPNCGSCSRCLEACPTKALYAPYRLNANRCIAYLTIEHQGEIPLELRPLIGTKIFGCDICQKCCPWNHQAKETNKALATQLNTAWQNQTLAQLFLWDEATYLTNTTGSPLHRLGYENWLRNIAIALGNSDDTAEITSQNLHALEKRRHHPIALIREHVKWAIERLESSLGKKH